MNFPRTMAGSFYFGHRMFKKAHAAAAHFYPGPALLSNGTQAQVVSGSSPHLTKRMGLLRHARPVERCPCHLAVSGRVYSYAESVHRFERLAGFEREGRCRRATTKPTYGKVCAKAARSCKHSSSCGLQIQKARRWMLNTLATFALTGGVDTEYCKYSDTNTTKFTWVPALVGSFGCSVRSSTITAHLFFTMLDANICNAMLAYSASTAGVLPKRKADRPAPPLPNRRGNGRCATLPRQQRTRTRTRKQSRSTLAGRAVA